MSFGRQRFGGKGGGGGTTNSAKKTSGVDAVKNLIMVLWFELGILGNAAKLKSDGLLAVAYPSAVRMVAIRAQLRSGSCPSRAVCRSTF